MVFLPTVTSPYSMESTLMFTLGTRISAITGICMDLAPLMSTVISSFRMDG